MIIRKSDKGEKCVEIRHFIHSLKALPGGVEMNISTGSRGSVKAEEVIRAYAEWTKKKTEISKKIEISSIHRQSLGFLKEKVPC
ncbi:MAG TPA: hypothetical protein V6C82_02620, partial [Chroococcales cyanobacterium]|jgi:hypothetical protein